VKDFSGNRQPASAACQRAPCTWFHPPQVAAHSANHPNVSRSQLVTTGRGKALALASCLAQTRTRHFAGMMDGSQLRGTEKSICLKGNEFWPPQAKATRETWYPWTSAALHRPCLPACLRGGVDMPSLKPNDPSLGVKPSNGCAVQPRSPELFVRLEEGQPAQASAP
jgi:hypothetical protein